MMTTSGEHDPRAIDWASHDALREAVAAARRERRQRGESYVARHRPGSADSADGQDPDRQSAWITSRGMHQPRKVEIRWFLRRR